jgi:SNF2 family DNA or RNA helicase
MKRFKKYKPVNLTEEKASKTAGIIKKWNDGKLKLLIGHPASMGHGIDGLQKSGSILVWFGMNWSLELYEQMNARLNRQGQTKPVSIIRILCNDTVDLAVADAIERKTDDEAGLKRAIERYRKGITTNDLEVNFF